MFGGSANNGGHTTHVSPVLGLIRAVCSSGADFGPKLKTSRFYLAKCFPMRMSGPPHVGHDFFGAGVRAHLVPLPYCGLLGKDTYFSMTWRTCQNLSISDSCSIIVASHPNVC